MSPLTVQNFILLGLLIQITRNGIVFVSLKSSFIYMVEVKTSQQVKTTNICSVNVPSGLKVKI